MHRVDIVLSHFMPGSGISKYCQSRSGDPAQLLIAAYSSSSGAVCGGNFLAVFHHHLNLDSSAS